MADEATSAYTAPSTTIDGVKIQLIYPQSQLVSVKLVEGNFLVWKMQILTAIKGYGLEDYLTSETPPPDKYISGNSQIQTINSSFILWNRQDQILASWILSSLSESVLPLIIGLNTSSEIWSALEKNFASQSKAKTLQYKLQLQTSRKGNLSMTEYLARIKMCCDLLATTGNLVSQNDHIMHILAGLGPEYDPVVVTVTASINSFALSDIQALLLSFETRLESSSNMNGTGAINTDGSQPTVNFMAHDNNQRRNFNGQGYGSRGRGNYNFKGRRGAFRGSGGRSQGSKVVCQVCHVPGHSADRCWHRYDQSYGTSNNSQNSAGGVVKNYQNKNHSLNMVHIPNSNFSNNEGWWYPDSGASTHVTSELNNMTSALEYNGSNKLQLGNGQSENISHIGNTTLHSSQTDKLFQLKDLLHVPSITKNLISVSKFALDNDVFFEFHPLICLVKDQATHQVLLRGMLKDGLYRFHLVHQGDSGNKEAILQDQPYGFNVSVCNNLDVSLWHRRFGHCSYEIVKRALRDCKIPFDNRDHDSKICHPCILAKSHKLPFGNSETQTNAAFDLVHTDLWGPAPLQSVNGYKYYVTYIDDYTKHTWIYLLKLKSEVAGTFIHFHNLVQTQFQTKIKMVQSDGGTEYKPLNNFFKENGIIQRISCPYTPEQNGCAERKHRHVVEIGLALLAQSCMPLKYWDDAFTTAVYLINRLPTRSIQYVSPYEKLTKQKPAYSALKVFGCLAYPHVRPYNDHKLEFRAAAGVFIGYSSQYKGYKILLSTGKVIVSRHVVFEESVFPFSKKDCSEMQRKEHAGSVFTSLEPTVMSFPNLSSTFVENEDTKGDNQFETPHSSKSLSSSSESYDTIPLGIDLPITNPEPILPDQSPHYAPEERPVTVNQHPMVTRGKAGIYKPKVMSTILVENEEPKKVEDALMNPVWRKAMKEEYDALIKNRTWTLVPLPKGAHVVGNKWVFKVKTKADGSVERHKARLVAQGFTQTAGFDFHETFSPVVKPTTIRIIFSIALNYCWNVKQLDVSNAFLNGELSEEIYMCQPRGFEKKEGYVCRLHKAIYGLKQAARAWFTKVRETLSSLEFISSKADNSLFMFNKNGIKIFVLIYVDDILVTGNNDQAVHNFIERLKKYFTLKDLGNVHHFLGIEVNKTPEGYHLCQKQYVKKLLDRANMLQAKSSPTPMITSPHLSRYNGDPIQNPQMYRSIVGGLHYATITRPDISFAVNKVSQYMANPLEPHLKAVKRILRYLVGTLDYGLNFSRSKDLNVTAFSDSDWGADLDDRKSVTGYCVYIGRNLVSWSSKKQQSVSRSSTEAEYRSLGLATAEITWIRYLLSELNIEQTRVPQVWVDNQSTIYLSANPILHARTKHIELDFHFIREKVAKGEMEVNYVPSIDQNADILTKALGLQFFTRLRGKLTVVVRPSSN